MVLTSSVRTFVRVSRTSCSPSRNAFGPPNVVASVSLFTSGRKDALWVKSQSQSIPPLFSLTIFSTNGELSPRDRYLVYNLRKRGGDSADKYFKSTELIAGVKDMRFQALMPDVLHWLGITKIDNMISMSDMCAFPDVSYRIYSYLCPSPQETRCDRRFRDPNPQTIRPSKYVHSHKRGIVLTYVNQTT